MPSLVILNLTQNSLSGNIPRQLCRMPALIADDSSTSDLRNLPLPLLIDGRQYYRLFNLRRGMAVGGNNLVGGIPDEMGQLKLLQELDLSSNNFNGGITSQLSSLTNLEKMDISRNHLCVDELIPEKNDSLETDQEAAAKEINKKTMRKIRVVVPEDKHTSPVKVKFRMGQVVDLQSDNNSPRKLRFRRARVLGAEDSKGKRLESMATRLVQGIHLKRLF